MGDSADGSRRPGRRGYGCDRLITFQLDNRITRQEVDQVTGYSDWSHSRAASTLRDTEGIMQVQVTYVGSDKARTGKSYLSIHIRTVHIYLSAILVNKFTDFENGFFKYSVRRRIGNHQAGKVLFMGSRLFSEIFNINIPEFIAFDNDDFHSGHRR